MPDLWWPVVGMHFPLDAFGHWPHCPPSKTWGACKKKMWFFDLNNMCLFLHLNTILFFMLFFQGLVVLNGIRYAFLRPTRFPLQIPKCRAPLKQHEASALPTIHRCQVVHPFAWQIQRYPANKSQIFSYVVYTIPSHCHQVSPMFIQYHHPLLSSRIMNYHQFSSTYCYMIKWSTMMVPASPYKSNHQSAIHRAAQFHAEICQRHAICILTSLRLGIHPGTPENMLPLDPERTRETRLWSW